MSSTKPDYLKAPHATTPSFHFRTGTVPRLPVQQPTNEFGFPQPGVQSPTPATATAAHYFVNDTTWANILDHGEFDDVVVGSGFCALAYVDEALKRDPYRKILILERGGFWLPVHFQNLPLPFKMVLGGPSETFPWTLSSKTRRIPELGFMHGSCPFFGGRSTFWSAWCPAPTPELMRGFPESMIETAKSAEFWTKCKALLHVTPADKISDKVFGELQEDIDVKLKRGLSEGKILTAEATEAAPLAVGKSTPTSSIAFNKFSTPGPLLTIYERQLQLAEQGKGTPLMIAIDCIAERFHTDEDEEHAVTVLETSRGALCFPSGKTNVILAVGAIPATTILLNSLGGMEGRAGSRLTGHFLTHIAARFPIRSHRYSRGVSDEDSLCHLKKDSLEIAASYLAGQEPKSKLQYHVQITAIHSPHPEWDAEDAGRECPDYAAAATAEQLKGSENYIVLVCATLGETDEHNAESWVKRNPQNPDVTTNVKLQITLTDNDRRLWDVMDKATYDAISVMADDESSNIEYWHDDGKGNAGWKGSRPHTSEIRIPGVVHEASTLYMGPKEDLHAAVDSSYRPHGCKNVYVTGAALFPAAGSWNPTLTMCGYAQDLARKIVPLGESQ